MTFTFSKTEHVTLSETGKLIKRRYPEGDSKHFNNQLKWLCCFPCV